MWLSLSFAQMGDHSGGQSCWQASAGAEMDASSVTGTGTLGSSTASGTSGVGSARARGRRRMVDAWRARFMALFTCVSGFW